MKYRRITKNAVKCKKCGDVIESTYRHGFVTCSCGAISVDGGHDYLRRVGDLDGYIEMSESIEVEISPKYKKGDLVLFSHLLAEDALEGEIVKVDTYEGHKIIEYDIMLKNDEMLYKHVPERDIIRKLYKKNSKKDKGGQ